MQVSIAASESKGVKSSFSSAEIISKAEAGAQTSQFIEKLEPTILPTKPKDKQ